MFLVGVGGIAASQHTPQVAASSLGMTYMSAFGPGSSFSQSLFRRSIPGFSGTQAYARLVRVVGYRIMRTSLLMSRIFLNSCSDSGGGAFL